MATPLQVLIVEDVEQDAELVLRELKRGGYEVTSARVQTAAELTDALSRSSWDVIISDYSMPQFSAPRALEIVKSRGLDLPFIIVSGTVGEETAVEAIRAGARDFMTKGHFARLIPAIQRELREAAGRAESRRMEEQLLISDRMASVGTLAAGVAHEINNPLAVVIANLDFAVKELARVAASVRADPADAAAVASAAIGLDEIGEPLKDAREGAERVRQIVRDLKVFSRSDEETRGPVDVKRVLDSAIRMAWNEIRHRARLVRLFDDAPSAEGNESRLGQVFLNLLVNAAQAIPEGHAEENEIRVEARAAPDGRVLVEIHDTGAGIPEAVVGRIFDPFFTTKPIGVGTGLGLAICHRIVTALGGEITVTTAEGKGTTFRTLLPAAEGDVADTAKAQAQQESIRRGRILVVDDEVTLGAVVRRMLNREHDVEAVTSGREALDRVARGDRFDVILCDLMMPEVSGADLWAEIARIAPELAERIVFMTGGAFTGPARAFLEKSTNPRIEKPFDLGTLRSVVGMLIR